MIPSPESEMPRLSADFFRRDVLSVAPDLPGKVLVRQFPDGRRISSRIIEVEAYRGTDDLACHASKGRTPRTEIMYAPGGHVYMYLIYGMYWMLNFVTGEQEIPQAVLIRAVTSVSGPGRLTRDFEINGDFNGDDLGTSHRIWLEDHPGKVLLSTGPRIGIDYAGPIWTAKPWRFMAELLP